MKIKRILVCLILVFAAVLVTACSAPVGHGENILVNGKFEDGLYGWTTQQSTESSAFALKSYEFGGNEINYISIKNESENKAALTQRVRVERGETYEISVEIRVSESFQNGTGAHLGVAELPEQTNCVTASFSTLSPARSASSPEYMSEGWIIFRYYVTAENVDYITVELRCGSVGGYSTGEAGFKNAAMKKINMNPDQLNYSKIKNITNIVVSDGNIQIWGFVFAVFFGLLFLAAAFFGYELLAKHLKNGDRKKAAKESKVENSGEDAPSADAVLPAKTKSAKKLSREFSALLIVLAVIAVIKLVFAGLVYGNDVEFKLFSDLARSTAKNGLSSFYEANSAGGIAPGYTYILWFVGLFTQNMRAGVFLELALLRLPALIADTASSLLIYLIIKRGLKNEKAALIAAVLYALNIAVFSSSIWWGQFDSIAAAFILLALYTALTKNYVSACFAYAAAVLFKFQAVFIAPVFIAYLVVSFVKNRESRRSLALGAAAAFVGWFIMTLFPAIGNIRGGEFFFIFRHYIESAEINKLTFNAFNFFGALGFNDTQIVNTSLANWLTIVMAALFAAFLIILLVRYRGKGNVMILLSGYAIAGIFTFAVNMREGYIFPAILLLFTAAVLIRDRRLYLTSILYSLLQFMCYAGLMLTDAQAYIADSAYMIIGSILSVLTFVYLTAAVIDIMTQDKVKPIKNYTNIFK